jgi:DNA-binding IclR family transcriptional regulator
MASADGHSLTMRRGLCVLRLLARHPDGLTVSEIADELMTHRSGIYRLLGPLTEERLVVRGAGGRHQLGLGLLELASAVRPRLQEVAARSLRPLADQLRATTALTIRDGSDAVVAFVAEPSGTDMHIAYRPGLRHSIDLAAPGLAILAAGAPQPDERPEVQITRKRGWSLSSGEILPGATGVAAAIAVPGDNTEACISAVWIDSRDPAPYGEAVVRAARAIAAGL